MKQKIVNLIFISAFFSTPAFSDECLNNLPSKREVVPISFGHVSLESKNTGIQQKVALKINDSIIRSDRLVHCTGTAVLGHGVLSRVQGHSPHGTGFIKTGIDNLYIYLATEQAERGVRYPLPDGGEHHVSLAEMQRNKMGEGVYAYLYKNGPVRQGGYVPGGIISHWRIGQGGPEYSLLINAFSVKVKGCSVTTPVVDVRMGSFYAAQFKGPDSNIGSNEFTVGLECDSPVAPSITFSGTNESPERPGVLALMPTGLGESARGIGIQISYKGVPVKLGEPLTLGDLGVPGGYQIPFVASYLQTSSVVRAGWAHSMATFTLNYD